ncbi:globin-coupled sensor protein [Hoeflea sp. BAL378]|uniref:methyl-accepting chemotaxis protein n=1 Tax=Hoeflea sp. BAL378 TaxID=1547437 RepID=UPI0006897C78|nr:globin-coupled sensor protein [Hoeflea sp. BAL378]
MKKVAPTKVETDQDIAGRLAFIGLDEKGCADLRQLKPIIESELPKGIDRFYDVVRRTPSARRYFSSDTQIDGAKKSQLGHWEAIASGCFNEDYVRRVRTIGAVHARIGLEPRWYIGGYGLLVEQLLQAIIRQHWSSGGLFSRNRTSAEDVASLVVSLVKAVMLDMDLSISVYIEQGEAAKKVAEQEAIANERRMVVETFGHAMAQIAAKNLGHRIEDDLPEAYASLSRDFNSALDQLAETIERIGGSADQINTGSEEIRSAADRLSKRAEQQAAAIEQTAAAVEEITVTVKSSTLRAEGAGKLVDRTRQNAEQSGEVMKKAVVAMDLINQSSADISRIIGVIDEIAFQTNLLALNAGVEAARAGEAGRGFAVVAQEVRELAQRSAGAAKEIKQLITTSGEHVRSGVSLVRETGEALDNIATEVREIAANVAAIIGAAQEQSGALQEINAAVSAVDQGTQQNAVMAEELTASSHTLVNEVVHVNALLRAFKTRQAERHPRAASGRGHRSQPSPAAA